MDQAGDNTNLKIKKNANVKKIKINIVLVILTAPPWNLPLHSMNRAEARHKSHLNFIFGTTITPKIKYA